MTLLDDMYIIEFYINDITNLKLDELGMDLFCLLQKNSAHLESIKYLTDSVNHYNLTNSEKTHREMQVRCELAHFLNNSTLLHSLTQIARDLRQTNIERDRILIAYISRKDFLEVIRPRLKRCRTCGCVHSTTDTHTICHADRKFHITDQTLIQDVLKYCVSKNLLSARHVNIENSLTNDIRPYKINFPHDLHDLTLSS